MSVLAPQSAFAAAPAPLVHEMVGKGDFADAGPLKAPKLDLRVKAFANCAIMRTHGGDDSAMVGPRLHDVLPASPNKTNSTAASETVLGEPHALRRQNSATLSTGAVARASRTGSPTKRAPAAAPPAQRSLLRDRDAEEGAHSEQPCCGLDFLLQACDMLEPTYSQETSKRRRVAPAARRALLSEAEPAQSQGSRGSRRPRARPAAEDGEYAPADSSGDDDYKPTTRSGRTSRRTAAASAAIRAAVEHAGPPAAASARWERGAVAGPCTNPDCESPHDSPQWRKGPPQCPILCNACGTRWLRNGTLRPLVPRRGIRYNRNHPRAVAPRTKPARAPPPRAPPAEEEPEYMEEEDDYQEAAAPAPAPAPTAVPAAGLSAEMLAAQQQLAAALAAHEQQAAAARAQAAGAAAAGAPALAGVAGMPLEWLQAAMFQHQSFSPAAAAALQQQLAVMGAAAQAAQQAMAAAAAAAAAANHEQPQQAVQAPRPSPPRPSPFASIAVNAV